MKILTGFAVINDRNGKRVTYHYDTVDADGNIEDSNKRESYLVLEKESKNLINQLEEVIETRMNK